MELNHLLHLVIVSDLANFEYVILIHSLRYTPLLIYLDIPKTTRM